MIVYGLSSCDTCRKAANALAAAGLRPQVIDVRKDGVSTERLAVFYAAFGADLVNRRSTTWRGLDEAAREADPLALLAEHPTLMKRPVIDRDGMLTLGWTKDVQDQVLGR